MLFCASAHPGAHVAQKEEADGGSDHDELSHPEGRVPAVLFGDGVEGEPCHKRSHCNQKDKESKAKTGASIQAATFVSLPLAISATTA